MREKRRKKAYVEEEEEESSSRSWHEAFKDDRKDNLTRESSGSRINI